MQFNIYITVKNPESYTAGFDLERIVRQSAAYGASHMYVLPDVDETVHLHEDAEVLITLNRSE